MAYENFLNDDFSLSGSRERGALEALNFMSENTINKVVYPSEFTIFSLTSQKNPEQIEMLKIKPDYTDEKLILPANPKQVYFGHGSGNRGSLPVSKLRSWGLSDSQIEEIYARGFFLQYHDENDEIITLIPSKSFLSTFCKQLGCGRLDEGINPFRDLYLASLMRYADSFQIVYRKNGNIGKVFACFSRDVKHTSQTVVMDIKEELLKHRNTCIRGWRIDHYLTYIDFAFTDRMEVIGGARVTPGVRFTFSDVGDASYCLQSSLFIYGGIILIGKELSKRHTKTEFDVKTFVQDYFDSYYGEIKISMQKIKDSKTIEVDNVQDKVSKTITHIGLKRVFGLANTNKLKESYLKTIPDEQGSQEDVFMAILKIPGNIRNHHSYSMYSDVAKIVAGIFDGEVK